MFFDEHKKISTLMRGRKNHMGERVSEPTAMKPEVVKNEDGSIDDRHTAMQDFLAAHQEGSPAKMAEAMANFLDLHSARGSVDASSQDVTPKE